MRRLGVACVIHHRQQGRVKGFFLSGSFVHILGGYLVIGIVIHLDHQGPFVAAVGEFKLISTVCLDIGCAQAVAFVVKSLNFQTSHQPLPHHRTRKNTAADLGTGCFGSHATAPASPAIARSRRQAQSRQATHAAHAGYRRHHRRTKCNGLGHRHSRHARRPQHRHAIGTHLHRRLRGHRPVGMRTRRACVHQVRGTVHRRGGVGCFVREKVVQVHSVHAIYRHQQMLALAQHGLVFNDLAGLGIDQAVHRLGLCFHAYPLCAARGVYVAQGLVGGGAGGVGRDGFQNEFRHGGLLEQI